MARGQMEPLLQYIHRLAVLPAAKNLTDGQLLRAFSTDKDEVAFEILIQRHGGLVLRVCRNLLRHDQDAEDAFQATFLVLARKAETVAERHELAGWLHRTAYYCSMQIKRAAARRLVHERQASDMARERRFDEAAWRELQAVLDEEIAGLRETYRSPFVLCCLQGKSKAEAAQELGWKEGTVSGRLARARKQLQQRLIRRGVTLSATLGAISLSQMTNAAVPAALACATVKGALLIAAGRWTTGGLISTEVANVIRKVTKAMLITKLKTALVVLLVVTVVGSGAGMFAYRTFALHPTSHEKVYEPRATPGQVLMPKTDSELIQGTWKVTKAAANGIHLKREESDKQIWHITGDKITIKYDDGDSEELTFHLDQIKKPKAIDLVWDVDRSPAAGMEKGQVLPGIYDLTGNSLQVCFTKGKPPRRPTTFEEGLEYSRDRGRRLFVLRREPGALIGNGGAAPPAGGKEKSGQDQAKTAEDQFKALVKEYDTAVMGYFYPSKPLTPEERRQLVHPDREKYQNRILGLAQENLKEPFSVDALIWIVKRRNEPSSNPFLPVGESANKAFELLAKDYPQDKRVGEIAEYLVLASQPAAETLLRALIEKNPDRNVQARACLTLANRFKWNADQARFYGSLARPADAKEEEKHKYQEAEKYFDLTLHKYGDTPYYDKWTMGDIAKNALFEIRRLRIGMVAPEIEGEDLNGKKFKLSDYRGEVVLLDFYWWVPQPTIDHFERSLAKKFEGKPFTILGINRDQDRETLKKAWEEEKITFRSWFDGGSTPGPITFRWNVWTWPTLYLLDHKGMIRGKSFGFKDLDKQVEKLIQEAGADAKSSAKPTPK